MPSRGTTAARARAVGVSVGVALLLGACTSGGSSGPTPPTGIGTVTPAPTPTPTPSEAPGPEPAHPEFPAVADQVTSQGAEAVARYFFELYAYVYATGDLAEWQELSDPECVFCASVVSNVEAMRSTGGYSRGLETTWDTLAAEDLGGSKYAVEGRMRGVPGNVYDADGSLVAADPEPREADVTFVLDGTDGWSILEVDVIETGTTS